MGLPETSPAPKKDSMGMDYMPVYADESTQGDPPGTVRISPVRCPARSRRKTQHSARILQMRYSEGGRAAMIHSSHRDRKARAIAEVLAMPPAFLIRPEKNTSDIRHSNRVRIPKNPVCLAGGPGFEP
jgi:hypothetical protein